MINAAAHVPAHASELAGLVRDHLDELSTYAAHLVGDVDDAVEFVAGGVYHASKYPPARIQQDGRAALFRAVTRACRQEHRYPPRPRGPVRLFKRSRPPFLAEIDNADKAARMNTVKRALMTMSFERRAALLLRDLVELSYREMAVALECSPDSAARQLAAARRDFGTIYREIAI